MKQLRLIIFGACILLSSNAFSEAQIPVIKSNTKNILIKINDEFTTPWVLMPEKKPDIFEIGSSLSNKKVKFVTDIDSIAFEVKAGQKINFMILLNGNEKCFTQIFALKDPFFFRNGTALPLFISMLFLAIIVFMQKDKIDTNFLLSFGIISPIFFWFNTIIASFLHGNYSPIHNIVSTLGEIGSDSEIFMAISSVISYIFCVLFSIGLIKKTRELKINILPAILSFAMAYAMLWVGFFPLKHELHGSAGPIPLILILAGILGILLWRGENYLILRQICFSGLFFMLLILLRFVPNLNQNYEGLIQRFFWFGWSVWFVGLGVYLPKIKPLSL